MMAFLPSITSSLGGKCPSGNSTWEIAPADRGPGRGSRAVQAPAVLEENLAVGAEIHEEARRAAVGHSATDAAGRYVGPHVAAEAGKQVHRHAGGRDRQAQRGRRRHPVFGEHRAKRSHADRSGIGPGEQVQHRRVSRDRRSREPAAVDLRRGAHLAHQGHERAGDYGLPQFLQFSRDRCDLDAGEDIVAQLDLAIEFRRLPDDPPGGQFDQGNDDRRRADVDRQPVIGFSRHDRNQRLVGGRHLGLECGDYLRQVHGDRAGRDGNRHRVPALHPRLAGLDLGRGGHGAASGQADRALVEVHGASRAKAALGAAGIQGPAGTGEALGHVSGRRRKGERRASVGQERAKRIVTHGAGTFLVKSAGWTWRTGCRWFGPS